MRTISIRGGVLLVALASCMTGQPTPPATAVCSVTWEPRPQGAQSPNLFIDNAEVAHWGSRFVVVGDPALVWATDPKSTTDARIIGGAVWDERGSVTELPLWGGRVVMYPRASATADGLLHIVYGSRGDLSNRQWMTPPETLWHTAYDGQSWSRPQAIPNAPSGPYWWEHISPSALVATGAELDIAIPIRSSDNSTIGLLQRNALGQWDFRAFATGGGVAAYVRLARLGSRLVLTWAAPDPDVAEDRASIFVSHSSDGGRTWTPHTRLLLAGRNTTRDHALFLDATGRGYLVWKYERGQLSAEHADSIGAAITSDTGRTWTRMRSMPVPTRFGSLAATMSPYGPLLSYRMMGTTTNSFTLLKGAEWITPGLLPGNLPVVVMAASPRPDRPVTLLETATPPKSATDTASRMTLRVITARAECKG